MWLCICVCYCLFFVFKQKTAYEMRISDWSSDVCSSDLLVTGFKRIPNSYGGTGEVSHEKLTFGRGDLYVIRSADNGASWAVDTLTPVQIGRASCRERVCQYV